ncbi:phage holin family protein [Robertkochia marina]|uniref:Phage holin family protein n=1 Tax=Robertkochia marina TaxID=1227945 RepID=A0A4S3M2P5_9FLAO|nr:phage holin family protein [Robertkochia marina]THD68955.1 phage holin family protein [Robertkochia marina]TRZ44774.1 phage holin family protein [Robertkochia marina]
MKYIFNLLLTALAVFILENILPGVSVDSFGTAIWVAFALSLLNLFVKPLLILFTLPVTILTLGLFLLCINAFIIQMADGLIDGFHVNSFWWALLFSLLLSVLQSFLQSLTKEEKEKPRN